MSERVTRMRRTTTLMLTAVIFAGVAVAPGPGTAYAQEPFDRGQALYEHHCMSCHEGWVHERESSDVTSVDELRRTVKAWSVHTGLDWGSEDIDDVTDYVNRRFYHLER